MRKTLLIIVLALGLTACSNDEKTACTTAGGKWKVDHMQPVVVMAGKTPVIQMLPIYACEVDNG
jgi:hypothetical protein